jgi:hypothetical protein
LRLKQAKEKHDNPRGVPPDLERRHEREVTQLRKTQAAEHEEMEHRHLAERDRLRLPEA